MIAQILIDNISNNPDLTSEWGLSIYIEHQGRKYLLDTGAGEAFAQNAHKLGVDLSQVDFGILSHAHYDHADGMDTFFQRNPKALFHLREGSGETCYDRKETEYEYIGIKRGLLEEYKDRIRYVSGRLELAPGVWLLPHSTPGLAACGEKFRMFLQTDEGFVFDDFCHEQSLVFDTEKGLIIFNSCCHGGADTIIKESLEAFPGRTVYAIIGGFHLFQASPEEVRAFGQRLLDTGVEHAVTGHCTGQEAFDILKDMLGDKLTQMETGLTLAF